MGTAKHFHTWTFDSNESVRAQMYQLIRLTRHGLEPEKGTDAVIEKLVMDRCLKVLAPEMQ